VPADLDQPALTFLADGEREERSLSYGELDRRARAIGGYLREHGLRGERVLLLFPPGLDYAAAFLGCLYAGVVAVPVYPPTGSRGGPRLQAILADCEPRGVLTVAALRATLDRLLERSERFRHLVRLEVDGLPDGAADSWRELSLKADDLAFLQYTSGSSGTPKGVMISHGNLLTNQRMIQEAFGTDAGSVVVSWLPLYHDMGLIGGLLHPLYLGARGILLSPIHFLQRPARWLQAVSRYRASVSGGPNFSYDLCARKITPEEAAGLDLSGWRVAFNGAEPVRAQVLERFASAFAAASFRREAFFPCYGLAEATLLVSGGRAAEEAPVLTVEAAALGRGRVEEAAGAPEDGRALRLVGCGRVPSGLCVRLVDPVTGAECPVGTVGEIWVAGESVAHGYWSRPRESAETFGGRLAGGRETFLRTGDLGFLRVGELFVTGRIKDLILIHGRNLYPQDIEWTVERSHPGLRPGSGAAFTVEVDGEERLVVVHEVVSRGSNLLGEVALAVRRAVAEEHGVQVSSLLFVKTGAVPKTTSGKIQRRACRDAYLAGELAALAEWREGMAVNRERVAPRTPAEEWMAQVWEEVLGLAPGRVGVEDSFFALGGDSLRGCQLLARLEEAGGEVTLEELFASPTLAESAARLSAPWAPVPATVQSPFEPSDRRLPLPLSSPQRRLWFLDQMEPGNPAYNLAVSVRLTGALDLAALTAALTEVSRRQEALRTVFRVVDGVPAQLVLPPAAVPLPLVDLSCSPTPESGASALEREGARRPFDLTRDRLLRVGLVRLAEGVHELQIVLHHIVSDGWSIGILLRETAALYAAFVQRKPSPLTALPVQYGDFARWQERRLAGEAVAAQLAAWRSRLGGGLPVLALPTDRPRPPVRSYRGAHRAHLLPAALTEGLRTFAGAHGASLFMILLAGFQALLVRITAQEDLILGTAVANRDRVELEGLIGFFVNTLALRTDASGDPTFTELLRRSRETVLGALAHREVPFERLVDELQPRRDLSIPPIVQVMMVLQNAPLEAPSFPGLGLRAREVDNGTARFDLALSLMETELGLSAIFKYSRDLFDAATVERLACHFETLLAQALADAGRRLTELPLLREAERHQIALEWNATASEGLDAGCLHELFEAQVDRTPEGTAVVFEGRSLTYRELDRRANQFAWRLQRMGVGPESLVGVAAERSQELVVALLGILKAGGAYLPLDPSYPADRLAFMMEDARIAVLLTQERLRSALPALGARVLCLDSAGASLAAEREGRPAAGVLSENPAYAIYTSGSTGRPKGAVIPHRGIVNRLRWMQAAYGLLPGEGVLQKTPASFDVSVWEFFWPLVVGARLILARPGGHQDSAYLAGLIAAEEVTTLHFVPSMLQVFLEEPRLLECTGLKRVIASGEALPRELADRFSSLLGADLHNLYGPTEAAVDVTAWPCGAERGLPRPVPIGRPISNLRVHLLDPGCSLVPIGVPGHLHIGGVGLARGYLRRPELTAERFVPDPFGEPGGRLYATGDLARLRPDGAIEFLERLDHQVKIRGIRIELGEIEAALNAHPAVRESVVTARRESDGWQLVAYLVERPGERPGADELRSFLSARLPEAMLPTAFVVLGAFPLTPSGKVDRKALPAPVTDRRDDPAWEAPRTPVESRLAAMWSEQLGVERVGRRDGFFVLGGDSIQGALFVNRLQRELDAIVYVMALFDHPTVARFAAYLEESYRDALVAVGWLCGTGAEEGEAPDEAADAADLEVFSSALAARFSPLEAEAADSEPRNPAAVFILSPFRSGSTLLRVMMAGHPRLFAPPELELLGFAALGERRRVFSGRDSFSREGLLRAVMELRGCDAATAAAWVEEAEERNEPTRRFYRRLQELAGGRVLVDKTPRYALDLPTLGRAERWFEEPLYIHLIRHPAGTMRSYLDARMQEVYPFPLPPRRQAELTWRHSHQHILEHLSTVPAQRQHRILFEDLVRDPRKALEDLCRFLRLDLHPAMLSPYEGRRMTDGLHGAGRMMGDPKFHQHQRIDAGVADRWAESAAGVQPGEATWRLAAQLGYARPAPVSRAGDRPVPRPRAEGIDLPLSFGQQRLWFLDRLQPGESAYNMPAVARLAGPLDTPALARACAEIERRHEVLRTVFPALAGRPRQEIREPRAAPLSVVDLGGLHGPARRIEAARLIEEEVHRSFDLAVGPLWRVRLLRLAGGEHLLLVNLHHIVCDGWSVGVLTRELAALYEAFRRGEPARLRELPVQYADFAAWQRSRLSGEMLDELLRFWKERLAGPLPVLELPLDHPRPMVRTHRGARVSMEVPAGGAERLRALARPGGATLFMVLTAGFQAFLHRYSGQDDLLVGTPVAGRTRPEVEGLVGLFVNTLVLRSDLSGDPDFRTLLSRVRQVCLEAARHEELPFERLVEELGVERFLGRSPLFEVMLAFQNALPGQLALSGLEVEPLEVATRTAKFDLTLDLAERPDGGLAGFLEYNVDLFDPVTAERLVRHLTNLIAGLAVTSAGLRLSELPLLAPDEWLQLTLQGSPLTAHDDPEGCFHHRLAARARLTPESPAVVQGPESLTFRELDERANQLARHLLSLGVGPESIVGICLERSPEMVIALLGVLKAGGAYLPLDPEQPRDRLAYMLRDAGARVLVSRAGLAEGLEERRAAVLLDAHREVLEAREATDPGAPVGPDNLAYCIYTSGSTGRPKGTAVRHRSVLAFAQSLRQAIPELERPDRPLRLSLNASLSFDASVQQLVQLLEGHCLCVVPEDVRRDGSRLAEFLHGQALDGFDATPSLMELLLAAGPVELPRFVLVGGEAISPALWAALASGPARVYNVYGPTECTVNSMIRLVAGDLPSLGGPLPGYRIHLLDRALLPVPPGARGEIHVCGPTLARGYWRRPELTAERFVPDPFTVEPGARMYRTGDLARRLPDGEIEYLGRGDHQVKIRGFRIEIGEVESVLLEHPAVRQAVVLAVGDRTAERRLAAYVVKAPECELSQEGLRGFLREKLPLYMIPSSVLFLDRLPLLSSGKVDRKGLPSPGRDRPDLAASYVSPQNEKERLIAQVWQEVLGLDQVSIHDNFFDLGGHSLLAAEVHGKLRERMQADFPLIELFQHPTVHALAGWLYRKTPEEAPAIAGWQDRGRREREASQRRRKALARHRGAS
jgi:amino acid adenylation domain-containing protein